MVLRLLVVRRSSPRDRKQENLQIQRQTPQVFPAESVLTFRKVWVIIVFKNYTDYYEVILCVT